VTQGTRFHRDPLGFLSACRERHGDVFTIRLAVAGPMVVFADPSVAADLLGSDPERSHTGEARRRILGMVSSRSVLGADGERHREVRARAGAAITVEAMDAHRAAMVDIAERHVASWPRGRPFRLLPRMRALCDEIFARLVVGVRDEPRAREIADGVQRMLRTPGNPPLPPPAQQGGLLGALGSRLFDRRAEPVRRLLAEELAKRPGEGLLGAMAELDRDDAIDELLPILMAGQEPPAAALTWLLDRLGREQELAERFLAAPDGDPLRDAVERETLRLRPAVHSSVRRFTEPSDVGGVALPAGAVAMVPIVLLHRDPDAFPAPGDFRPERWLSGSVREDAYWPFGGGARRCLGEPLAHAQIGALLPAILRRVRLRPLRPRPERMVVRGTVLVPRRSAPTVARAR
jgi:cytochrome P450